MKLLHSLRSIILNEAVGRDVIADAIRNKKVITIFYEGDQTINKGYREIELWLLVLITYRVMSW